MSSNFHNTRGTHVNGLDVHNYFPVSACTMDDAIPAPYASGPFFFASPAATLWKRADRVTSEGKPMLQQGYDFYLVAHFPAPIAPPHPVLEPLQIARVILSSGSKIWMAVQSVSSGGNPLGCCVESLFSCNLNCSDPTDLPTNLVINLNSVETLPTAGDYAAALAAAALDALMTFVVGGMIEDCFGDGVLSDVAKQAWRRAPDVLPQIEDGTTKPLAKHVKQAVDGAP